MGAKLLGYADPSELIGKDAMSFVHPDYRQIVLERTIARQRGDSPPPRYEVKLLKKDGTAIDVEFHVSIAVIDGKRFTITYARNIEERVRYRSNLKALYRHINELAQADTVEAIIDTTLDAMSQALEFEFSSILQVVEDRLVLYTKNPEYQGLVLSLDGRGLTVQAANTQSTILVEDTRKEPNYLMGSQTSLSELDVPVIVDDKTVAVLNVEQNTVNAFNENHKILLETLASHVSAAFYRLENEKQLK
ncbi:GAF domain-containing protein, partial [Candidatus Bathyarchaeota archaeon]|nr:GAF domain-containing protein [Candidatus Bathyarchaeota archaeon]